MPYKKSKSIARTFLFNAITVITVTVAVLGHLYIFNERQRLNEMAADFREEYTNFKKTALKDEVRIIISHITHVQRQLPAAEPEQTAAAANCHDIDHDQGLLRIAACRGHSHGVHPTGDG